MKRLLLLVPMLAGLLPGQFTEFYADAATGSNMNGGAPIGAPYPLTYVNGAWDAATGVFTAASGNPEAGGVQVGDFASVYNDGATAPVFVGRVTARNAATVTVSLTAASGTAPTTSATGRTITVGGAWKGPNESGGFPLSFVTAALTDASRNTARVNLKNGTEYSISAGITMSNAGPIRVQGYTDTVGDGGKATLNAGTNAIVPLTIAAALLDFSDLIVTVSAVTGANPAIATTTGANATRFIRVVAHGARGSGFKIYQGNATFVECEAYNNGAASGVGAGGFEMGGSGTFIRCNSHHNPTNGWLMIAAASPTVMVDSIAHANGKSGVRATNTSAAVLAIRGLEAYANGASGVYDGIQLAGGGAITLYVENSNFIKNSGYGINAIAGSGTVSVGVANCGFGSGTEANGSGDTNALGAVASSNNVTYPANATPWIDPANGDFRIKLAAAKKAGRGAFTQTAPGYAGTVGYPDIGAAQHEEEPCSAAGGACISVR